MNDLTKNRTTGKNTETVADGHGYEFLVVVG
jgi:hypothetical protein